MAAKDHNYAMHKGQYWVFETAKTPRTRKTKLHTVHGGHTVDFDCPIPVLVVLSPRNKYLLQFLHVLISLKSLSLALSIPLLWDYRKCYPQQFRYLAPVS